MKESDPEIESGDLSKERQGAILKKANEAQLEGIRAERERRENRADAPPAYVNPQTGIAAEQARVPFQPDAGRSNSYCTIL